VCIALQKVSGQDKKRKDNMKRYNTSLFIFRRDLRLTDNTALLSALSQSELVIPCFIFDPEQVSEKNDYKSKNALQFMIESLQDLEKQFKTKKKKLYLFKEKPDTVIKKIITSEKAEAVFVNYDYTPYSKKRDQLLEEVCKAKKVDFLSYHDVTLQTPLDCLKKNEQPYTIFTPFFKNAFKLPVAKPVQNRLSNFYTKKIAAEQASSIYKSILNEENNKIFVHGGRTKGLTTLKKLTSFKNYNKEHDFPALEKTTGLSAHNKFGTISIREVFHAIKDKLGSRHPLIRQLYWRDFFTHITFHFPHVFGQPFHEKYKKLTWNKNKKDFQAWCDGKTGFPIIDAGMRQLNQTGFMHNRVRMIVASFLTKDLHIDWRWGEKYFAQKLVDYDPSVNNGNWQWAASTGCDAQPYFRIFNPWLQQKKFDNDCDYIKQWIPELKKLPAKLIHRWEKEYQNVDIDYPKPMVNHKTESSKAKALYKKC